MKTRKLVSNLYEESVASRERVSKNTKREPSLILVGETPTDASHPKMEAEIIKEYKPKVVLLEDFDTSKDSEENLRSLVNEPELWQRGLKASARDIGRVYKMDLKNLLEFYILKGFSFDGEPFLLIDKPLGDLDAKEILYMERNLLRLGDYTAYLGLRYATYLKENAKISSHSKLEEKISDLEKIGTIIEKISKIEGVINEIWEYKHRAPVYEAIREVNATPAGCGVNFSKILTIEESEEIFSILLNAIVHQVDPETIREHFAEKLYELDTSSEKESGIAENIKGYVKKSKKPVVAIVKKYHLRENSRLLDGLKGIKYQIIELPETERLKEKELQYELRRVKEFMEYISHSRSKDGNSPTYLY